MTECKKCGEEFEGTECKCGYKLKETSKSKDTTAVCSICLQKTERLWYCESLKKFVCDKHICNQQFPCHTDCIHKLVRGG